MSICIISIDDAILAQHKRLELALLDSIGQEILSTQRKRKEYIIDHTPNALTQSHYFYFGQVGRLKLGDHYYALSKEETVDKAYFFLAMPQDHVREMFGNDRKYYLQVRAKIKGSFSPLLQLEIDLADFQDACSSRKFWDDSDMMDGLKVKIE